MGVPAKNEVGVIRKDIQARKDKFDTRAFQGAVKIFAVACERFNRNQRGADLETHRARRISASMVTLSDHNCLHDDVG